MRSLFPKRIFTRFLLIIIAPAVLVQGLSTFMFYHRHWSDVSQHLVKTAVADIVLLVDLLHQYPQEQSSLLHHFNKHIFNRVTFLLHAPEDPIPSTSLTGIYQAFSDKLDEKLSEPHQVALMDDNDVTVRIAMGKKFLELTFSRKRFDPPTTYIFILWMVGSSILFVAISILFMRTQIRSIVALANAAESFGKGQKIFNFKPSGAIEVRQAGQAFLKMMERVERQILQRTELLAGVSHDLRTPLTRLTLQLAMMPPSEEITLMQEDLHMMGHMIQEYLNFAKSDGQEAPSIVNLGALIQSWVEPYRIALTTKLIIPPHCMAAVRPIAIKRALHNLLDNAKHYATSIEIKLRDLPHSIEISIADNGPGIPADKTEEIFRPFYRLDEARTLNQSSETHSGVGLGLAITRDIISSHGGTITATSSKQLGGAKFVIRLPK